MLLQKWSCCGQDRVGGENILKFYMLTILVKLKISGAEQDAVREILAQIQTDGKETILYRNNEYKRHEVVKKVAVDVFPDCLTTVNDIMAFAISFPTQKDLGRRWFLKRLEGSEKKTFHLIATTDVSVVHVEV